MVDHEGSIVRRNVARMSRTIMPVTLDVYYDDGFHDALNEIFWMGATTARRSILSPEKLSKVWNIGLDDAKRAYQATTQRGLKSVLYPDISRRYRTNDKQLRYKRLNTRIFTDTMFANVKSTRGNVCGQVFTNDT